MGTFTPIAMKCNQEQFEAVKPKLKKSKVNSISPFSAMPYLINNRFGVEYNITNYPNERKNEHDRIVHEEWNEEIFLKACGIEVETLQEKLQKAQLEVERLKNLIEEENKPKVGDICLMDNGLYEFIALFKERNDKDIERLNIRKLTKQQLIEWYDSYSTKN